MNPPIAIVAGAGGELGRAVVVNFVGSGYAVVAVDRNEDKLRELPDGVHREAVDATDPAAARPLIDDRQRSRRTRRLGKHPRASFFPARPWTQPLISFRHCSM